MSANYTELILDCGNNIVSTSTSNQKLEWLVRQQIYRVELEISNLDAGKKEQIGNITLVVCNSKGLIIDLDIMKRTTVKVGNETVIKYVGESTIAKFLKSNKTISLGFIYSISGTSNPEVFQTNKIAVTLKSPIAEDTEETDGAKLTYIENAGYDPDDSIAMKDISLYGENSAFYNWFQEIYSTFQASISLKSIEKLNKKVRFTYVTAIDGQEDSLDWEYPSLEELGAINSSGGGNIGDKAEALGGFAGGLEAKARKSAVALGPKTYASHYSVGIGKNIRNYGQKSVVIGLSNRIDRDSFASVFIGGSITGTNDNGLLLKPEGDIPIQNNSNFMDVEDKYVDLKNSPRSVLIGNNLMAADSASVILIGDDRTHASIETIGIEVGDKEEKYKNVISNKVAAIKSPYSIAIGRGNLLRDSTNTYVLGNKNTAYNGNNTVIIGTNIKTSEGHEIEDDGIKKQKQVKVYSGVAIGKDIVLGDTSCIAIGPEVKVGTRYNGNPINSNASDKNYGLGTVAAIGIGKKTWASRPGSIAIGSFAQANNLGSIAIGPKAVAGNSKSPADFKYLDSRDPKEDPQRWAVAIGYGAKCHAAGAMQLGYGTNTEAKTLNFRKTQIVNEKGLVVVDLAKGGCLNELPVKKGGTGSTGGLASFSNLGLTVKEVKNTITSSSSLTDDAIEVTVKFDKTYKSAPHVFAEVIIEGDASKGVSPLKVNHYIKKVSTKDATIKLALPKPTKKNSKLTYKVKVLAIGNLK